MADCILAIDQGTTSSRAVLIDRTGATVAEAQSPLEQVLPRPGWVEHDPAEIWRGVVECMNKCAAGRWERVAAIGITNQRETTVLWDRASSRPVHNAIVWQDRRTADRCAELSPQAALIEHKTGLVIDAYFSATKLAWLLDNSPVARSAARDGKLAFGTIDSWLIWNLTAGRVHATDFTNASRTMLYDIHARRWDDELLTLFEIPAAVLPEVRSAREIIGHTDPSLTGGRSIPIAGVAGDQQAALFGQRAWNPGQAKNTYGTGAFLLMNVGENPVKSNNRLLLTLAADERGRPVYALEGSIFVAGASIQWLRDQLRIIESSSECDALARSLPDNGGVCFVPAFVGLGAPQWRPNVRGAIFGLSRGSTRANIVRAALEAMAFQTKQVIDAMQADSGTALCALATDGGASRNDWLMQFQADLLGVPVLRSANVETTVLGAAYLAGLAVGLWPHAQSLPAAGQHRFNPQNTRPAAAAYEQWANYLAKLLA